MRVLAIESSGWSGSVAAAENGQLLRERQLDPNIRTARTLAPAVDQLLQEVAWQPKDIQLIAVTQGPGSFTGLRVGVTTANLFAYAVQIPLMGVNTLAVIAAQVPLPHHNRSRSLWVVLNAERDQLFAGQFTVEPFADGTGQHWQWSTPTAIRGWTEWRDQLTPDDLVAGTGLMDRIDQLPSQVEVADEPAWHPHAATVAQLGLASFQAGQSSLLPLVPDYFRESAAVEKRALRP